MYKIHVFSSSALAGVEWSASRPGRFTPVERAPGTHWIGGWVDPRADRDDVKKKKFLNLPGLELRPSVLQPVASRYADYAIPAPKFYIITVLNMMCRFRENYLCSEHKCYVHEKCFLWYSAYIFSQFRNINIHLLLFPTILCSVLYCLHPDPCYRNSKIWADCRPFSRTVKLNWSILDVTGLVVTKVDSILRCTQEGKDMKKALRSRIYSLQSLLEHGPATSILLPTRSVACGFARSSWNSHEHGQRRLSLGGAFKLTFSRSFELKERVTMPFTRDEGVCKRLIYAPFQEVQAEP
jgi:hypothetical protein